MRVGLDFCILSYELMLYDNYKLHMSYLAQFMDVVQLRPNTVPQGWQCILNRLTGHGVDIDVLAIRIERCYIMIALDVIDPADDLRPRASFRYQYRTSPSPSRYHP
jgi:hypothetical protein